MSSYIFYPREKTIKTNFTAFINWKYLIAFPDSKVWIFYSVGNWILYDIEKGELVCKGEADKWPKEKLCDFVKAPRVYDDKHVVYVNSTNFKLQCLNVFTGELDKEWCGDAPCFTTLTEAERTSNEGKVIDTLNSLKMEVLHESKLIAVLDNKDTNQGGVEYALSFYEKGTNKSKAEVVYRGSKSDLHFAKANEKDTVIVWEPHFGDNFEFHAFNINKKDDGFKKYTVTQKINASCMSGFPWGKDTITLFGNPDDSGVPRQYTFDMNTNQLDVKEMTMYYPKTTKTNLTEVIPIDYERKNVLAIEMYGVSKVVIYNTETQRAEFYKEQKRGFYSVSTDASYIIEYDANLVGDEDLSLPGETKVGLHRLVERKVFLLHLLKNLKAKKSRKTFFDFYGDQYVIKSIAEMICGHE
mmetsp:Transcript_19052/g.21838  ORF Transcript_19052/g.21838 Transcript_19052/m.21838 type:complete len:412 (-) Transcript_19052:94-1329(-)